MTRAFTVCVVALTLLQACTAFGPVRSNIGDEELLEGRALPWSADALETSAAAVIVTAEEVFGLDREMRAFVAPFASADAMPALRGLLVAMRNRGLFDVAYTDTYTRTASGTFHERRGNCLSYTMLFVALARAAGLDVRYQVVDVPPAWNNENGLIVVGLHVNARVETPFNGAFVVDFNEADVRQRYGSRAISDRHALALFYNNLGAEALGRREHEASFVLLREAARTHPNMPGPWVNLGVLYARHELYAEAEASYARALQADPTQQSALSNLVAVYVALGESGRADEVRAKIRRYREVNPYYHFAVAQAAYDDGRFDDALGAVRSAIRLKRDDDEFYSLQGRVFEALGRSGNAVDAFARAKALAPAALAQPSARE